MDSLSEHSVIKSSPRQEYTVSVASISESALDVVDHCHTCIISTESADRAEVLERAHEFEEDPERGVWLSCSIVVFEIDCCIYVTRVPKEVPLKGPLDLAGVRALKINLEEVFPLFDATTFTKAVMPIPERVYRKLPTLVYYSEKLSSGVHAAEGIEAELITREARVFEILMRSPHPNIVSYYGCKVQGGRIVGLYLERLDETLVERMERLGLAFQVDECMEGVRGGVQHIHSLGLCHNDLNPANIMFRDDTPIVIDFDSCQPKGEELTFKVGTEDWYNPKRDRSAIENDLDALKMLERYIRDDIAAAEEKRSLSLTPQPVSL